MSVKTNVRLGNKLKLVTGLKNLNTNQVRSKNVQLQKCCEANLISPLRFHEWFQSWGENYYKERGMKNVCNLTDLNWLLWLTSKILDGSGKYVCTDTF